MEVPRENDSGGDPDGSSGIDLDRLAYCVAIAETGDCTRGIGPRTNNCHGVMKAGKPVYFASKQESYDRFKEIWQKGYGGYPTLEQAQVYTGNDHPETWLSNVRACLEG